MSEARSTPSNLKAMLMSVVPGVAQVYLDHLVLGAVLFALFVTAVNGLFLSANLQSGNTGLIYRISLLSLVLLVVGSVWHAYALSYGTDRGGLARDRRALLREALISYLRDDLETSAALLEQAIGLDVDWQDPDPLFHLGVVMLRIAEKHASVRDVEGTRSARRRSQWAFRTCLSRDPFNKWKAEIRRETRRMRKILRLTGRTQGLTTSERLVVEDGSDLNSSFPELRESGAVPRPDLSSDLNSSGALRGDSGAIPRTRHTPRPFERERLRKRLAEADALANEETVNFTPGFAQDETVALEEGAPTLDEALDVKPRRPRTGRLAKKHVLADTEVSSEETEGELHGPGLADTDVAPLEEPSDEEEQAATRPAQRPLLGEDAARPIPASQPAGRRELEELRAQAKSDTRPAERPAREGAAAASGAKPQAAPPEGGLPETRPEARPEELPETRANARSLVSRLEGSLSGDTELVEEVQEPERKMPSTRLDVDPRTILDSALLASRKRGDSEQVEPPEQRIPPTRLFLCAEEQAKRDAEAARFAGESAKEEAEGVADAPLDAEGGAAGTTENHMPSTRCISRLGSAGSPEGEAAAAEVPATRNSTRGLLANIPATRATTRLGSSASRLPATRNAARSGLEQEGEESPLRPPTTRNAARSVFEEAASPPRARNAARSEFEGALTPHRPPTTRNAARSPLIDGLDGAEEGDSDSSSRGGGADGLEGGDSCAREDDPTESSTPTTSTATDLPTRAEAEERDVTDAKSMDSSDSGNEPSKAKGQG